MDATEDARTQIKQKILNSLTLHQRVVYEIVREHAPIEPSDKNEYATEAVDDTRTKRTVRTYHSKMEQYNLLEVKGTSRDRKCSLVDSSASSPM